MVPIVPVTRYDLAWWRKDMYTFIKVRSGTDPESVGKKISRYCGETQPRS